MVSFYAPIDLIQNELRNARIQNLGAAPTTPVEGQLYYDSAGHVLYWWNGTTWVAASAAAGGPPSGPAGGDLSGTYPNPTVARTSVAGSPGFTTAGSVTIGVNVVTGNRALYLTDTSGALPGLPIYNNGGGNIRMDAGLILMAVSGVALTAGGRIISVSDPTAAQDAATKNYVDNAINGTSWRAPVRVATTANIALTGTQTIDGIAVVAGDRVLVKNQTTPANNGIYVVAAGAWARSTDADAWTELVNAAVFVSVGATQADTAWVSTVDAGGTIGTTAVTWVQFGAGAVYTAGNGLQLVGNQFSALAAPGGGIIVAAAGLSVDNTLFQQHDPDLDAIAALTTVGFIVRTGGGLATTRTLTPNAPITILNGDGNANNPAIGIANFSGSAPGAVPPSAGGTTTFLRADGQWAAPPTAPAGTVTKFAAALTGTVAYATGEVVTHNLNTRDVHVAVVNGNSPYQRVECDWEATTVNTITVRYSPNLGAGFRCIVMG